MNSRKLKSLCLSFCISGALIIGGGIGYQIYLSKGAYIGNVTSGTEAFPSIRELIVISTSMPISVSYGDCEDVTVEYTSRLPLIFSTENGRLRVTQNDSFMMRIFSPEYENAHISVTLPHKGYESISVSSSSGDIEIDSINSSYSEASTKNGNIKLLNIDERTKISTESGHIVATYSSLSGDAEIRAGTGLTELYMPPGMSFGIEFLTDGGYFISDYFDESYGSRMGDVFALSNPKGGAEPILHVSTTGGNLILY